MMPEVDLAGCKKSPWWEHALRFLFGGLVTVGAGLVAHRWGPGIGGLFLAFPSILPASLTLLKRHDGRKEAVAGARGARIGAIAMAAFALAVVATVRALGEGSLAVAAAAWIIVASGGWWLVHGRSSKDHAWS